MSGVLMRLVARTGGAVAALSLGLALVPAVPAQAAVVHVGCNVEELRDAIDTANGAGGGTIDLAPKCTYTLTDANTVGSQNGFPDITTDITLKGGKRTVIERSSAPGTPEFRLFRVGATDGELTLNRLTLRNGSTPFGGVALVFGSIAVISCQLTGNHATIDGGAINGQPESTITVTSSELEKNTADSAAWRNLIVGRCHPHAHRGKQEHGRLRGRRRGLGPRHLQPQQGERKHCHWRQRRWRRVPRQHNRHL